MNIVAVFHNYSDVITGISSILTAIGTISAVIVALWLSNRDGRPKLKVSATVAFIAPEISAYHLWLSCVNEGKQAITCNSFAFAPKISKPLRIIPTHQLKTCPSDAQKMINFSEKFDQHFDAAFFTNEEIFRFLGRYKWLARIKLRLFWRVVVNRVP